MTKLTRRRLLAATGGVAAAGLFAGCAESAADTGSDGSMAEASFFVFGDVAAAVAGDAAETELLVPIGQHGHGWEPGPRVREEIRSAALFIHGLEGFQPWVDDILRDLEADGATVESLDVTAGLDLLEAGEGHEDEADHGHAAADHTDDGHAGDSHTDDGHATDDHTDDGHDDDHTDEDHTEDAHDDHSGADPHFWMDPLRVTEAVGTVRDGLAGVDGDNAEAYTANAERYQETLQALHDRIETTVEAASNDVLLVAGHDSFRYLGDRYGVHVEALTSVSPDDRPTTRDIEHAQEVIAEHGLQYICADPLESQQAAEQLVAETDAEEVLPLTAMPGLTDEWVENDWGYVEVMEHVNVPTLERVLGSR